MKELKRIELMEVDGGNMAGPPVGSYMTGDQIAGVGAGIANAIATSAGFIVGFFQGLF